MIVVGVPAMSPDNRNEAIRFTKLIDATLRERRQAVRHGGGRTEDLYTAGDGAFEFERTVSRLKEMHARTTWRGVTAPDSWAARRYIGVS